MNFKVTLSALLAAATLAVNGEQHVVHFDNRCGYGTPTLIQGGNILSSGEDYVANSSLLGAIAYLQTGSCGYNGENCTLLETTLQNPLTAGGGSSSDISLISPHQFSVPTGFGYYNGCEGAGADCTNASCPTAYHQPDDDYVLVGCQENNVNLVITFCL